MLVLDRVGKTYPKGVRALEGVSLAVPHGEILVVVGGSGCGKSTLLRAISGLDTPSQGTVALHGAAITAPHEAIGIIFQEPRLLPWLDVADNFGFGLEHRPKPERRERVATALARVGLTENARMWPRELSGGQAQRVAIARALVPRPLLLLADEPTGNLDAATGGLIADLLFAAQEKRGTTLVLVTHDLALADRSDRVVRLTAGRIAGGEAVPLVSAPPLA